MFSFVFRFSNIYIFVSFRFVSLSTVSKICRFVCLLFRFVFFVCNIKRFLLDFVSFRFVSSFYVSLFSVSFFVSLFGFSFFVSFYGNIVNPKP